MWTPKTEEFEYANNNKLCFSCFQKETVRSVFEKKCEHQLQDVRLIWKRSSVNREQKTAPF